MSANPWTRREILEAGAAAMALPTLVPAAVLGRDGAAAASETFRVGVIGCGGRSRLIGEAADVKGFKVVAACDCVIQRATTLCYLVNIARDVGRVGEALKWDPAAERFTNCDQANDLLDRPRRKGYELPDIG